MSDRANVQSQIVLTRLEDTDLTVVSSDQDIRGRTVFDRIGEEVGDVSGLLVDSEEYKVRFIEVSGGRFLGIGEKKLLIPVDAITRLDEKNVYIDQTRQHVGESPQYDPDLTTEQDWGGYYGHYGYSPYWNAGYVYPAYSMYGIR